VFGLVSPRLGAVLAAKIGGLADGLRSLPDPKLMVPFMVQTAIYWGVNALGITLGPWEYHERTGSTAYQKVVLHAAGAGRLAQVERVLGGSDPDSLPFFFVHGDPLGSAQVITKSDGTVLAQEEFFAYGRSSDRRDSRNRYDLAPVRRTDALASLPEVLMTTKQRRSFTREFKAEAVKLVLEHRMTMAQVSRELGVGESVLGRWVQNANVDAGRGPAGALTTKEREELTRLRREIGQLRMEREILKKAAAFFAKESL
jgi:transposase